METEQQASATGGGTDAQAAAAQEPIVVTGGSVILEYPDTTTSNFEDYNSSPGTRKKLKHKLHGTDRAELTFVRITDRRDNLLLEIDLRMLGKHKDCKVKIFYDEP